MSETAVLLCGHGSRDPDAIVEFEMAAAALRARLDHDFATGYLEFARPTIQEGLGQLVARGARHILAVPGMLFAASVPPLGKKDRLRAFSTHPGQTCAKKSITGS